MTSKKKRGCRRCARLQAIVDEQAAALTAAVLELAITRALHHLAPTRELIEENARLREEVRQGRGK